MPGYRRLSQPGGLDKDGLPIGIQLLGQDFSEALLLRLGKAYEDASAGDDWRKVKPAVMRNQ